MYNYGVETGISPNGGSLASAHDPFPVDAFEFEHYNFRGYTYYTRSPRRPVPPWACDGG